MHQEESSTPETENNHDIPDVRAILAGIKSIDTQISKLTEQREAIDIQISDLSKQRAEGIEEMARARDQIDQFLGASGRTASPEPEQEENGLPTQTVKVSVSGGAGKAPPKYRNPHTGQTWSGRGKPPNWIAVCKDWSRFLIKKPKVPSVLARSIEEDDAKASDVTTDEAPKDDSLDLINSPAQPSQDTLPGSGAPSVEKHMEEPRDLLGGWDEGGFSSDEDIIDDDIPV